MKQTKDANDRILYVVTDEIQLFDIPRVLEEMEYEVYHADFGIKAQEYNESACQKIIAAIDEFKIRYVISYDFIQTISQACMEAGIPYIAWVYDAPQKELYTHYALYPCNYVFAFDKMQVKRLKDIGIKHVVYMPLAVHVNKVKMVTETIGKKMKDGYQHDISFIGRMYKMEEDAVFSQMDEDIKKRLHQNIESCFMKWDKDTRLHGIMDDECVAYLGEREGHWLKNVYPYMSEQFYYEVALLSRMLAYRERTYVLNKLAEKYDVTLYTNDKNVDDLNDKVKIRPGMSYDVLSHVYKRSKINLHISLHCIETGVSQRVQDIMASGAFVLSNYQEELEELFVPGKEIVFYHNEQELEELVEYYLTHDEEREQIARNGQEKVLRDFDYCDKLSQVLHYVNKAEENRKESYIACEGRELREKADRLLEQKTEVAYRQLYEIFTNKVYETTIKKNSDLMVLRIMVIIWHSEHSMGISCIFDDVDNVQQAERKYLELKHSLWRIEQELSFDKCMSAVENMRRENITKYFVAQTICIELCEKEETIIKLAKMLAEFNLLEAVEMLTYGLLFFEGNSQLLILKANYLMKLNLWSEALGVLQMIKEPSAEIAELTGKISEVVHSFNE